MAGTEGTEVNGTEAITAAGSGERRIVIIGGECTGWERKGYHIDGCIHWLVGTKEGTPMNDLWKSVGALDGVPIHHPETFLTYEHESGTVPIYRDLDRLRDAWVKLSPQDAAATTQSLFFSSALRHSRKDSHRSRSEGRRRSPTAWPSAISPSEERSRRAARSRESASTADASPISQPPTAEPSPPTRSRMMAHTGRIKGLNNFVLSGQWLQPPGGLPIAVVTGKDSIQRLCRMLKRPFVGEPAQKRAR
jgi:phytoene dehydrogenase-like protein